MPRFAPSDAAPPTWLLTAPSLADLPAPPAGSPPTFADLIEPNEARGIATAMLSTPEATGEIEVETIVARISQGATVLEIPRRARRTLGHGVQLLIDHGEGMLPFREDVERLRAILPHIVGTDRLLELGFDASPTREVWDAEEGEERGYLESFAPLPRMTVLCVTDLGIGRPRGQRRATTAEWTRFARQVVDCGALPVALVPYPEPRWPKGLIEELLLVPWSPSTTASAISRLAADLRDRVER